MPRWQAAPPLPVGDSNPLRAAMQQLLGGGDKGPMQARYDRLEQALVDYFKDGVSWKKRVLERVHAHVCAGQRAQTFDAAQGRVKSAILDHESWFTFFFPPHPSRARALPLKSVPTWARSTAPSGCFC